MQDAPRISNNYFDGLPVSGRHKAVFFIIMIAYFCEQMDNWNFGFIAPALMHNWGLTMKDLGTVTFWYFAAMTCGGLVGGVISDIIGRRKTFLISITLFSTASIINGLTDSFHVFVASRALTGFGVFCLMVCSQAYIAEMTPAESRGKWQNMGCKVDIVEAAPHIAPLEDADVAKELLRGLQKTGISCHEGARAKDLRTIDGQARLTLDDGTVITAAKALVAVGRTPNTKDLGAENLGCTLNRRGYVTTNECLEAAPNVYAVGDVNGRVLLAHAAEHQAAYVAERILGENSGEYQSGPVPSCVYGGMEVMRVGQTATALLAEGKSVEVSQAPLSLNPIAQASGGTAGFVKVVWTEGAHRGHSRRGRRGFPPGDGGPAADERRLRWQKAA